MNTVNIIANWATGFIEAYCLFMLCETFLLRRKQISKIIYILGIIVSGILINIINGIFSITILNIATVVVCEFIVSFLFIGKIKIHKKRI